MAIQVQYSEVNTSPDVQLVHCPTCLQAVLMTIPDTFIMPLAIKGILQLHAHALRYRSVTELRVDS